MKEKIAAGIVRHRNLILLLMILLTAAAGACIGRTNINYDLTRYLSADTMTRRALEVMEEEFGSSAQIRIMFENTPEETVRELALALGRWDEILFAAYDPETDAVTQNGMTRYLISLTLKDTDATPLIPRLRELTDGFPGVGTCYIGGQAASLIEVQNNLAREMPAVMLISVAVIVLVLLATSRAWMEPLVILLVLAASIVINMGTNFIFPDVSFITFAVCAILQLALSIDYAIMLLHTYHDCGDDMEKALCQCFMRIASSAMTTAAGLMSLLFMSFTIGFDIGIVLSKGILISMLTVFLMMPGVTLLFDRALKATRHRPIRFGGDRAAAWINRHKRRLAILLVLPVLCGLVLQSRNTYTFTDAGSAARTDSSVIDETFGISNPLIFLVPGGEDDDDYDRQRTFAAALEEITLPDNTPAVGSIASMVTTAGAALEYYSADEIAQMTGISPAAVRMFFMLHGYGDSVRADILLQDAGELIGNNEMAAELSDDLQTARTAFIGPHYDRMILELNFMPSSRGFSEVMDRILETAGGVFGEDFYVTGSSMSGYDIGNAFHSDLLKVNLITFLAIFVIVSISFMSWRFALLLVFIIEGAIWITMGFSRLIGQSIFFMSYLICLSIQMGATIDYGILFCDQYRTWRRAGMPAQAALGETLSRALPTILTSGTILVTAGGIIGKYCSIYYISSIGSLLARGAFVSAVLILTLLPSLLLLLDRFMLPAADSEGRRS
ncbi:MAG: MMPL family transporter [Lachnospiraceae bacterium]|nr:MMPL family transporter [Lachnospiraceae bacterium]